MATTDMASRVPDLSDSELSNLKLNADRLVRVGNAVQQAAATALLSRLDEELSHRQTLRGAARKAGRAARIKAKDQDAADSGVPRPVPKEEA